MWIGPPKRRNCAYWGPLGDIFVVAVNPRFAVDRRAGERANAQLKAWRILRKIRSSPNHATDLINAVQTLILAN